MVHAIRGILGAILIISGKRQTLHLMDLMAELGATSDGAERGDFFYEFSCAYSDISNLSGALKSINEIPDLYLHKKNAAFELLAEKALSLGRINMAKQILLNAVNELRQHEKYENRLSPTLVKLIFELGFINLAIQGLDVISQVGLYVYWDSKIHEILSDYQSSSVK